MIYILVISLQKFKSPSEFLNLMQFWTRFTGFFLKLGGKITSLFEKIQKSCSQSQKQATPPSIQLSQSINKSDFEQTKADECLQSVDIGAEDEILNTIQTLQQTLREKEYELKCQTDAKMLLQHEKDLLMAKYLANQTAHAQKKQNLDAYYAKKKEQRRAMSLEDQVAAIVGKGPKWMPHSSSEPKSHLIGKPKGGRGGGRNRPDIIHETTNLYVHNCIKCGANLTDVKGHFVYTSIVTELYREQSDPRDYQTLRLKNVLQRHERKRCPQCHHWNYPQLGLLKNCRFGLSFVTFVISQRIEIQLPYERLIRDLQKIFGNALSLSQTAIINWFLKFEEQLHAMYNQLALLLKQAKFNNVDESGMPMNGENWWLWLVCSANIALYKLSASRGHESVEDILKDFKGTIIADFFSAYKKFDQEQQKCLAHLLSDIIELIVGLKKENGRIMKAQQSHDKATAQVEANLDPKKRNPRGRPPKVVILDESQQALLKQKNTANLTTLNQANRLCAFFRQPFHTTPFGWKMPMSDRITSEQAQDQLISLIQTIRTEGVSSPDLGKILLRCERYKDSLFTYLKYENMPPDNNGAERGLRKYAVQRRVSGGFKSPELMNHYTVYLSLFMTCKINGKDFDLLLKKLFQEDALDLECFLFDPKL